MGAWFSSLWRSSVCLNLELLVENMDRQQEAVIRIERGLSRARGVACTECGHLDFANDVQATAAFSELKSLQLQHQRLVSSRSLELREVRSEESAALGACDLPNLAGGLHFRVARLEAEMKSIQEDNDCFRLLLQDQRKENNKDNCMSQSASPDPERQLQFLQLEMRSLKSVLEHHRRNARMHEQMIGQLKTENVRLKANAQQRPA